MSHHGNRAVLRSPQIRRITVCHVACLLMIMSSFCANAERILGDDQKSQGVKTGNSTPQKRSGSQSAVSKPGREKAKSKSGDKKIHKGYGQDHKDGGAHGKRNHKGSHKDNRVKHTSDHPVKHKRDQTRGSEGDPYGGDGPEKQDGGSIVAQQGSPVIAQRNADTVGDKAVVDSSSSSSEQASPHAFSFGVGSGAGAQGYIECVSGIIALTMSNQEASMGIISEIPVSEGQSVQKGDVLLVSSHYNIREKQKIVAELEYNLAKTDLEIAKNKSQKCKEKLGRHEKMLFSKAVSRQEFENIQKESAEADLVLEKQKISLQIAEQKIELCKDLLEQCQIRAPMDGTILIINGKVGEQSRPHEGLLIMADLTRLEIVSEVHENDISKIFIGQRAEISFPNKMPSITGYVKYISSIVRSNTLQEADPKKNQDLRVIEVRISLTDEDSLKMKSFLRMHADVRFFGPDDDQVNRSITAVNQARAI
jgi:biotin carboxyl carrier protein